MLWGMSAAKASGTHFADTQHLLLSACRLPLAQSQLVEMHILEAQMPKQEQLSNKLTKEHVEA